MPRFNANISLLFGERPLAERFDSAAAAGFRAVEIQFPYPLPIDTLAAALDASGLTLDLFNLPVGDIERGELGLAALPGRVDDFRAGVDRALAYAAATGTRKLNCLVGQRDPQLALDAQLGCAGDSLGWAADRLGDAGLDLLVEVLCPQEAPDFLLSSLGRASRVIEAAGRPPNLRLQFDVYHVQRAEGDVTARLEAWLDSIGHVQVADTPGRGEPGTGELDFGFILGRLDSLGYTGRVGLEYRPTKPTEETLGWVAEHGWSLDG